MFAFQTFYSDSYLTHQDPVQTGISPAVPGEAVSVQLLFYLRSSLLQQVCRVCESSPRNNQTHLTCRLFVFCVKLKGPLRLSAGLICNNLLVSSWP